MGLFDQFKATTPVDLSEALVLPSTPNLDAHLAAVEEAPTNDLKPGDLASMLKQAAKEQEGTSSMNPIMIAQLVIMGMGLIADLVKAIRSSREGEDVDDAVFESAGGFLAKIGGQAGVKELNQENISALLPAVKTLITKVHELRASNKD